MYKKFWKCCITVDVKKIILGLACKHWTDNDWLPEVAAETEAEQQRDQTNAQQGHSHVEGQGGDGESQVHPGQCAVGGSTTAASSCCIWHHNLLLVSLQIMQLCCFFCVCIELVLCSHTRTHTHTVFWSCNSRYGRCCSPESNVKCTIYCWSACRLQRFFFFFVDKIRTGFTLNVGGSTKWCYYGILFWALESKIIC